MPRILVIEDDASTRALVRETLASRGNEVLEAIDGASGLRSAYAKRPDLVVLDIAMDGIDGWETLARLRQLSDVPVLMLSGYDDEAEKVRALRGGADDYLTKPFGVDELPARVDALLRRAGEPMPAADVYADDLLTVDFHHCEVTLGVHSLQLTPLEFRLLAALVRHPNRTLSSEQLLQLAWGDDAFSPERVKLYVGYLRGKLRPHAAEHRIETVRGFGYRYRTTATPR